MAIGSGPANKKSNVDIVEMCCKAKGTWMLTCKVDKHRMRLRLRYLRLLVSHLRSRCIQLQRTRMLQPYKRWLGG